MKKRNVVIAIAAVLLIGVFGAAAQQLGSMRHQGAGNFFIRHLIADLNLSDSQRASIKQILVEERPAIQELAQKAIAQNYELREMPSFDEAKVRSIAQTNSSTYVDMVVEREKVRTRIFAVLTPDQRAKVLQWGDQFREGVQEHLSQLGDNL
jgi:Spy/CpxP family protein refolding chaperone